MPRPQKTRDGVRIAEPPCVTSVAARRGCASCSFGPPSIVCATGTSQRAKPVRIEVFAAEKGANAGANGFGWFVDMEVDFLGQNPHQAGFTGLRLTGPMGHNNVTPFPGLFSPGREVVIRRRCRSVRFGSWRARIQPLCRRRCRRGWCARR